MSLEELEKEIKNTEEGSDIHGLTEKIAYHIYLGNFHNSPEADWFDAQEKLIKWADFQAKNNSFVSFPEKLHALLKHYAHQRCIYNINNFVESSFDVWMYAQNRLAEQILDQVKTI